MKMNGLDFEKVAKSIIRKFNTKNMFCIIDNEAKFGWCHYAFRYLTTIDSLREIDFYMRDTLRAMKTGKHNKANINALNDDDFKRLGWVSLVDMYILYKRVTSPHVDRNGPFFKGKTDTTGSVDIIILELGNN